MNASLDSGQISPLFVGSYAIERARMDMSTLPTTRQIQQVGDLDDAFACLRQSAFDSVVIELGMLPSDVQQTANWILEVARAFPEIDFALFGDDKELDELRASLPFEQGFRLSHYFSLNRECTISELSSLSSKLNRLKSTNSRRKPLTPRYEFDAAISYEDKDRAFARELHAEMSRRKLRVFFDESEHASNWGKVLPDRLEEVYGRKARYCLIIASQAYVQKQWTLLELKIASGRMRTAPNLEYILLIQLDKTTLPDLPDHVIYLDANLGVEHIAIAFQKRKGIALANYAGDA